MKRGQREAAFYHAHKDDPDIWGDAEERDAPRQRRTLSATITVRFSPEEAERIRRTAEMKDVSYSDVVRDAVKAYTEPHPSLASRNVTQYFGSPTSVDMPRPEVVFGEGFRASSGVATRSLGAL